MDVQCVCHRRINLLSFLSAARPRPPEAYGAQARESGIRVPGFCNASIAFYREFINLTCIIISLSITIHQYYYVVILIQNKYYYGHEHACKNP